MFVGQVYSARKISLSAGSSSGVEGRTLDTEVAAEESVVKINVLELDVDFIGLFLGGLFALETRSGAEERRAGRVMEL